MDGGRGTMTRFLQTTQGISNKRFSSLLDLGVFRREEEAKKALQMETVRVYKSKSRKRVYFGTMSLNQTQMMVECCSCSPCISIIFAMKPLGSTALSLPRVYPEALAEGLRLTAMQIGRRQGCFPSSQTSFKVTLKELTFTYDYFWSFCGDFRTLDSILWNLRPPRPLRPSCPFLYVPYIRPSFYILHFHVHILDYIGHHRPHILYVLSFTSCSVRPLRLLSPSHRTLYTSLTTSTSDASFSAFPSLYVLPTVLCVLRAVTSGFLDILCVHDVCSSVLYMPPPHPFARALLLLRIA